MTPEQRKTLKAINEAKRRGLHTIIKAKITDKSGPSIDSVLQYKFWDEKVVKLAKQINRWSTARFEKEYKAAKAIMDSRESVKNSEAVNS